MVKYAQVPMEHVPTTLETMTPGQMTFPDQEVLFFDPGSFEAVVYTDSELAADDAKPKDVLARVGIMRVYDMSLDGVLTDGYVGDLRHLDGPLESTTYRSDQIPSNPEDRRRWDNDQMRRIRLLGLKALGPEGEYFSGDDSARASVDFLVEQMDQLVPGKRPPKKTKRSKGGQVVAQHQVGSSETPSSQS